MDIITKNIDYILLAEGHKEPSKNWSKITRKFILKNILVSAAFIEMMVGFKVNSNYIY